MANIISNGKLHRIVNDALFVLYVPYVLVIWLSGMVLDGLIGETNAYLLFSGNLVAWCGFFVSLTAHLFLYLAGKAFDRGQWVASYVIRFLPLIIMFLAFANFAIADSLARR